MLPGGIRRVGRRPMGARGLIEVLPRGRRLESVVYNRKLRQSEITHGDTLTSGGRAPQIEMSAAAMAAVLHWQAGWHTSTCYPQCNATARFTELAARPGDGHDR